MPKYRFPVAVLLSSALLLGACSDDPSGPSGDAELNAVQSALATSGALGPLGAFAVFVFPQGAEFSAISVSTTVAEALARAAVEAQASGFDAFGMQIDFDIVYDSSPLVVTYTGLVAWTGLNVAAESVDEAISVIADGAINAGGSADLSTEGYAMYINNEDDELYFSTEGTFAVTALSFGSSSACGGESMGSIACSAAMGTMSGNFNFTAVNYPDGLLSVTKSSSYTSLPAVRVSLTGSYPN